MYTDESLVGALVPDASAQGLETLSAAAAVHGERLIGKRVKVKRLKFHVTVLISGAAVVRFLARPTPGSATGQVVIGVLNIPTATAVGKVVYKDVEPYELPVGYALAMEQTSAANVAGAGYYGFDAVIEQEVAANESNMIASA